MSAKSIYNSTSRRISCLVFVGGDTNWLPTDIYHFLNCATRLLLAYPSVTTLMLLVLANPTVTTLVVVIVRPSSCYIDFIHHNG